MTRCSCLRCGAHNQLLVLRTTIAGCCGVCGSYDLVVVPVLPYVMQQRGEAREPGRPTGRNEHRPPKPAR